MLINYLSLFNLQKDSVCAWLNNFMEELQTVLVKEKSIFCEAVFFCFCFFQITI